MTTEDKKPKEIPGLKQLVGKEIVGNAIVMIILVLLSWWLTFRSSWGPSKGIGTILGYIACMVPFFTVIQAYIPFINKRAELMHGKWELKDDEKNLPAGPLFNIWTRLLPAALAYGFGVMLLLVGAIKLSNWMPSPEVTAVIVLIVLIFTTSTLIKKYLPEDLLAYAKALREGKAATPRPLAGYMFVEHVIPFVMLQGYINACVANRAFHFELAKANLDYVPGPALLPDAVIVFILLALFQWMFSNALTRGDVRLGKVPVEKLKNINGWAALGVIFIGGILTCIVYYVILTIGHAPGLSVGIAILFKMAVMVFSIILGAWIGIRWGGSREYALMNEKK
jgi:hypothetical protein